MNKNNPHSSRIAQEQRTVAQMIASTAARKRATGSYARNAANCWNMHTCACPAVRSAKRRTLADSAPFIATSPK